MAPWQPRFHEALERSGRSRHTARAYRQHVDRFVRWFEETSECPFRPQNFGEADAVAYRQYLLRVRRLRPASVNQALYALRWFGRWAMREGLLAEEPMAAVPAVRRTRRRQPAALVDPEVHALLRAAGESPRGLGRRNYALIQLLLQAGLRVGELVALRGEDLVVRERSGLARVRQGKGEKDRDLPLNATARRALRAYAGERPEPSPTAPFFQSAGGMGLSVRAIEKLLTELARRAKITRIPVTPHTLRHTFAVNYLRDHPGQLVELADLLGHDSLDTTAVYTRPALEELARDLEESRFNVDP
jgi:integrase/recombinase XerC